MREYAGGRPSQSSVARRPSPCTPTLLGTEVVLRCCVCCVVDFFLYAAVLRMERCADLVSVFFGTYGGTLCRSNPCILRYLWWYAGPIWPCILRYLWWYAVPIWFLYSSIFMVIRCADPVSVFFDTYRNILYQSDISGQDAQSASIPRMFFPVGWKRQPEEGGIGPGCCGGGVITTWAAGDGVIAAGSAVWAAGEFWPCRNAFSRLTEP